MLAHQKLAGGENDPGGNLLEVLSLQEAMEDRGNDGLAANREIDQPTADRFHDSLKTILNGIQDELMLAWN